MGLPQIAALLVLAVVQEARAQDSTASLDRAEAVADFVGATVKEWSSDFFAGTSPFEDPAAAAFLAKRDRARVWAAADGGSEATPAGQPWLRLDRLSGTEREFSSEDAVREAVERGYGLLLETLGGAPSRPLEVAVKRVVADPDLEGEFQVDLRVRALSLGAGRVVEGWWRTRWSVAGDQRELLDFRAELRRVLGTHGTHSGTFEDVAGGLLMGPSAAPLGRSVMDLRGRTDATFRVGVLGHHGVSVADVNGDGIEDLYLPQPGGLPNQLWLRQADGTAVEVGAAAGLDILDASSSALFIDLDGDGDRDVVLASGTSLDVFARTDSGYTLEATVESIGITSLASADVDLDGRLDVYACAYAGPYSGGAVPTPYHDAENGQANILLMNRSPERDVLRFVEETEARGLAPGASRFSFSAAFEDIDGDGDADLYVANDFGRNALYVNKGDGHFHERAVEAGVVDIAAGMGAVFADLDQNGTSDLYVSNMESSAGRRVTGSRAFKPAISAELNALFRGHAKGNSLYLGAGNGRFDATTLAEAGRWAWGSIPVDLDGNGALDLYVPNGFVTGSRSKAPDL